MNQKPQAAHSFPKTNPNPVGSRKIQRCFAVARHPLSTGVLKGPQETIRQVSAAHSSRSPIKQASVAAPPNEDWGARADDAATPAPPTPAAKQVSSEASAFASCGDAPHRPQAAMCPLRTQVGRRRGPLNRWWSMTGLADPMKTRWGTTRGIVLLAGE
jgi:hypothetical protein